MYQPFTTLTASTANFIIYRFIYIANTFEAQFKALAEACSPASFGRNKEDIVDESYRKAGKMDPVDFATQISPWDSGVLRTAVETHFKTSGSTANLAVELNVYGALIRLLYSLWNYLVAHID